MAVFLLACVGLTVGAAAFAAALLRDAPLVTFLLGTFVVSASFVVAAGEALSLAGALERRWYAIATAAFALAGVVLWRRRESPLPRRPAPIGRDVLRHHPLLAGLGLLVAASVVIQAFLVTALPPNTPDALTLHLPRTLEWLEHGRVAYLDLPDERFDFSQPNAGYLLAFVFSLSGSEALVEAPQLLAELALLAAVFLIARHLGHGRPASLFAALLFGTTTLVVVQATTAQNDLLAASFVAAAAALLLEARAGRPAAALLSGLALGLAVGTKLTAALALPALALLAAVAFRHRPAAWPRLAAWACAGVAAVGAYGYVLNLAETGSPLGGVSESAAAGARSESTGGVLEDLFRIGESLADFSPYFGNANEDTSRFGALGWLVVAPASALALVAAFRRRRIGVDTALALALPLFVVALAVTVGYHRFVGRFLIIPAALTMPLAAWLYGRRLLALPVALVAAATLVVSHLYNAAKPTGIDGSEPVWLMTRPEALTVKHPPLARAVAAVDAAVPSDETLGAVVSSSSDWVYPLYGPELERDVVYLRATDALDEAERAGLGAVVFGARTTSPAARAGWRVRPVGAGWRLAERH